MFITSAHTPEQFSVIEGLARRIVPDFYTSFFERATADYLVDSGHTAVALAAQADRGYRHFLIEADRAAVSLYRKNGYRVVEEVLTRLGNGAVLEDFRMRKVVES